VGKNLLVQVCSEQVRRRSHEPFQGLWKVIDELQIERSSKRVRYLESPLLIQHPLQQQKGKLLCASGVVKNRVKYNRLILNLNLPIKRGH
jgi:hypothetical protein